MSRKSWDEHTARADETRQAEEAARTRKIRRMGLVLGIWLVLAFTVPIYLKYNGYLPAKVSHLTHRKLGPATGKGRRDGLASPQTNGGAANKDSTQSK